MIKELFIGCMPFGFSQDDLRDLFEPHCEVKQINFFEDWENARFDAYAHVEVEVDDLEKLIRAIDGQHIQGKVLRVNERVKRIDRIEVPRRSA